MGKLGEIHVCVPVLNRYDLLEQLTESLSKSELLPSWLHVIDNGMSYTSTFKALRNRNMEIMIDVFQPEKRLGVAESWNWFINHVQEERVITNDDVIFAPKSLGRLVSTLGALVTGLRGNALSCFIIRQECIDKVGLFDESISPGYAYFEDVDYEFRLRKANVTITHVDDSELVHMHSQTMCAMSPQELHAHHGKFLRAQENFIAKWGTLPEGMARQT